MFGVLCFLLGVRMSLSVEGAGHMLRRCAATLPFFRKRHPYTQFPLLSRRGRRCRGRASSGIDSPGFILFKCFVCRQVPVYSSRVVIRRVESVVIRSRVCCVPVVYRAYVHRGRWNRDRSDCSGNWGLCSWSCWMTAIVANTLNGLGGRLRSFKLGGTIGCWAPNA